MHHKPDGTYQLRGMAVDSTRQRGGIGAMLLAEIERLLAARGAKSIWANCRTPAVPFHGKFGWKTISEQFVIETAGPHYRMRKTFGETACHGK